MTASNFTTSIIVDKPASEVFNAINNVRGWWQGEINGHSQNLNDEFTYRMKDLHYSKQRVAELAPNKKVVWQVTDSSLSSYKDKNEWTGTQIVFELSEIGNQTEVRFTHVGLGPSFECYNNCSQGWRQLIQKSLFSLITIGEGKKVFA